MLLAQVKLIWVTYQNVYACRIKEVIASGYSKHVVDPDKSITYEIVQSYVNSVNPKVSTPLLANWKNTMDDIPKQLNYTHMYEYLVKRTAVVLRKPDQQSTGASFEITATYELPTADKPLTKGFNFYGSGHVQEIKVNNTDGHCHVWSSVMASMKDKTYLSKIVLEGTSGVILRAECQCVAGCGGKCNHIAAVLFALIEYRESMKKDSCTSNPQQWHLPSRKSKKRTRPQKIGKCVIDLTDIGPI